MKLKYEIVNQILENNKIYLTTVVFFFILLSTDS